MDERIDSMSDDEIDTMIAHFERAVQDRNTNEIAVLLQLHSAEQIRVARGLKDDPEGQARLQLATFGVALERNPAKASSLALMLSTWIAEDTLKRHGEI